MGDFDNPNARKLGAAALLAAAMAVGGASPPAAAVSPTSETAASGQARATRNVVLATKGSEKSLRAEAVKLRAVDPVKSAILTSALDQARLRPGFDPAAISISFKLKW